jgi:hypothetical protein
MKNLLTCFLFFCALTAIAQNNGEVLTVPGNSNYTPPPKPISEMEGSTAYKGLVELYVAVSLPDGQFAQVSKGSTGGGFGLGFALNPFHKVINTQYFRPFIFGLQGDYVWFSTSANRGTAVINGNTYSTKFSVNTGAFSLAYHGRIELLGTKVFPMFVYQAGIRRFEGVQNLTYTAFNTPNPSQAQPRDISHTLSADWTTFVGYGPGIGMKIGPARLDIKVLYQKGTTASYIDPNSVSLDQNNNYTYKKLTSTTDMITTYVGVSVVF